MERNGPRQGEPAGSPRSFGRARIAAAVGGRGWAGGEGDGVAKHSDTGGAGAAAGLDVGDDFAAHPTEFLALTLDDHHRTALAVGFVDEHREELVGFP